MKLLKKIFNRWRKPVNSYAANFGAATNKDYKIRRQEIERFFTNRNKLDGETTIESPSKNYSLTIEYYEMGENNWNYSRGIVKEIKSGKIIADIKRNYSNFWHSWVVKDRNEYLICGEDYQGQTVINLSERKISNYFPEAGEKGFGFCWANVFPSPNSKILAVEGCYWANPYDLVFFDFSHPDELPYRELKRIESIDEIRGWNKEGFFELTYEDEIRKSDGMRYKDLPEEEQDEMDNGNVEVSYRSVTLKIDSNEIKNDA